MCFESIIHAGVVSILCVGALVVLWELASVSNALSVAPHLLDSYSRWTITHLACPLCVVLLVAMVALTTLLRKRKSAWVIVVLLLALMMSVFLASSLYRYQHHFQRAACTVNCGAHVENVSAVDNLEGRQGITGAFCSYVSEEERCYVHDPTLVVSHSSPGLIGFFSLVILMMSVTFVSVIITTTLPNPSTVTYSDIGVDILYYDRAIV